MPWWWCPPSADRSWWEDDTGASLGPADASVSTCARFMATCSRDSAFKEANL